MGGGGDGDDGDNDNVVVVVFADFMDMMMLQNAQMHHMVMQQMMLQQLPGGSVKFPTAQVPLAPVVSLADCGSGWLWVWLVVMLAG